MTKHQVPYSGLGCGAIAIVVIFGGLILIGSLGAAEFHELVATGKRTTVTIVAKGKGETPESGKAHTTVHPWVAVDLSRLGGEPQHPVEVSLESWNAAEIGSTTTWYAKEGDATLGVAEIQRGFMDEFEQSKPSLWWLLGGALSLWAIAVAYHLVKARRRA